ncbi:TetR family transcriptional regulator [Herbihabitans rhizosphaerae]|uniref:TetR family transcriptional regulator n=1 Tax=Herbihabitans rhizosphaerae TaxID=1872711 RepID=A0A4Q7KJU3_9PSEU|nr:TetR/AcrR family transcriptional regulator [Herbihabitans rhizosphaerae]RZS36467.1 TetR family transcriptional regulator [Herbihabitans rhizosphaerae]
MEPTARTYAGVSLDQRRDDRRERLLAAALDQFTSVGFQNAKITHVCTTAGVSTRSFYEVFPNKEALLLALHARINQLAYDRVSGALASLPDTDLDTRVGALLDVFLGAITSDPRLPRLNYVEAVGVNADVERQHEEWVIRWGELIEQEAVRAAERGAAPRRDYHLTAISVVGAVTGLLREWQAHTDRYEVADITAEIKALMLAVITRER